MSDGAPPIEAEEPAAPEAEAPPRTPPSPRLVAWVGGVMIAVAALTAPLAYLGNLGFAPLIALAGLACIPVLARRRRPDLGMALATLMVAWALATLLWSPALPAHPDFAHYKSIEQFTPLKLVFELTFYGAFVAAAHVISRKAARRALLILALALFAFALLFLEEAVFKAPLHHWLRALTHQETRNDWVMRDLARVAYVMALLFWPAALRLREAGLAPLAAVVAVAVLIGSFLLNADAPFAALGVSSLVFLAVLKLGRPAVIALLVGVLIYFIAAPGLIALVDRGPWLHPAADDIRLQSWQIRLDIWRFAVDRIGERPWWGWGFDASRTFSPSIPLHTHNAAIQLWLELGAVGAALGALIWGLVVIRIDQLEAVDRPAAAAAAGAASAYLTIGALSFGVWQEWWLALGALAAALCIALAKAREASPEPAPEPVDL